MELSIFDVIGNGVGNQEISENIVKKLQKKYNTEFSVKRIGNRYGTNDDNTVTTYCCPQNNENLMFTAILNKEQTSLEDDYPLRSISFELEQFIKNKLKDENINALVKCTIIGLNKISEFLSVNEFINKFNNTNFLVYIVSDSNISDEILQEIFTSLDSDNNNIFLKSLIYTIDKNNFNEFFNIASTLPSITDSIIENFSIKEEKIMKLFEGTVTKIK